MEELYNALVEQGKYTKSFEDFKAQFSAPEKTKMLYESLSSSGDYTKSFEKFTSQFGFTEKKNQVDTPSGGQEEVTESITETETIPGSSDSLEEQDDSPVIQDDSSDSVPFVEFPVVEEEIEPLIPDAPNRKGVLNNEDGSVSTHKMKTETDGQGNWFSFPTVFQNEDGSFVDMSEEAEQDWEPVYEEAKKRGEVSDFGTDKESAISYGKGSWKPSYDSKKQNKLLLDSGYLAYEEETSEYANVTDTIDFDKEGVTRNIIPEREYGFINPETGQKELKKASELSPELLEAVETYDTATNDVENPNYLDVDLDEGEVGNANSFLRGVIEKDGGNVTDYLKWEKKNTRNETGVYKWMKNVLLTEEPEKFFEQKNYYEKVQSYKAAQLNQIANRLAKNEAQLSLTSDPKQIKELKSEGKELVKEFKTKAKSIATTINDFPDFKKETEDTDLRRRKAMYEAAQEGGAAEGGQGLVELLSTAGNSLAGFGLDFFASVPAFFDQRIATIGKGDDKFDDKGFLKGLEEMFTDSKVALETSTGAVKRSAFLDGKPVLSLGKEYIVDENGTVYDANTNIRMDGIISPEKIKEIQTLSKDVTETVTNWTGGSVAQGGVGMLVHLYGLIRTSGKVTKKLGFKGPKGAGLGMGLTSFASGITGNVEDVRSQLVASGMSEKEAMDIAVNAGQAISTLDGIFSGLAGGNQKLLTGFTGVKEQIKNLAVKEGTKFTVKQLVDKGKGLLKENAKELFIEELPVYFSEKGINYLVNRHIGNEVLNDKITKAGIMETVVMTVGATSGLGSRKLLSGNRRSDLVRLAAANVKDLQSTLDVLVKEGSLTEKESSDAYTEIYNMQSAELKTQGTIKVSENLEPASDLLTQRQNLINKKQGLEGPGKDRIDKQIAAVDQQLDALYKKDELQVQEELTKAAQNKADVRETLIEEYSKKFTDSQVLEALKEEGIESPTEQQIQEKSIYLEELRKERLAEAIAEREAQDKRTPEVMQSLKEEGIESPTEQQIQEKSNELLKKGKDAIPKQSTEKQVLPDAKGSQETGSTTEVGLQQVGEGDVEQVTTDTQVKEGETQTDTTSDTTTEGDAEQLVEPTSTEEGMSVKGSTKSPKILGKKPKMVTVNEYNALKTQIKLEARAAKEAQQDLKKKRKAVNDLVKLFSDGRKGQFSPKQLQAVMNRSESTNFYSRKSVDEFLDYMEKVFNNAEHISKEKEGVSIKTKIKNKIKKDTENSLRVSAKEFLKLDPKKVSDIDEYLNYANTVLNGLGKTKIVTKKGEKKLKIAEPFNVQDLKNYTIAQNKIQSSNNLKNAREYFTELTGLNSDKMTIEQMQDLINETSEVPGIDKEKIEENKKEIKKGLLSAIKDSKEELNSKTQALNLSVNDRSDLKELLDLDISKLNTKKQMELLTILINFNVNGSLGGAKSFVAKARGNEEMEKLVSKGIKSVSSTSSAGRSRNDQLTTLPLVFELMFKGQSKARDVMNALGFNDLMFGSNKAKKQIEKSMSEYSDVFRKIKTRKGKYFDEYNTTERGIIAELLRIEIDSELSEQQQFDNTKSLIKQTYEAYFNTGNKLDNDNGKIIEEIYNKVVDKSSNISDLESKVDPANLKGVNYVIENIWGELRPQLVGIQKSIYNEDLSEDVNFTPRTYFRITNQETNEETNLDEAIFEPKPRQSPYDKKSSTLMKANRSGNLPSGKVLNLGFDSNNFNKAEAALTDVLTASAIRQIQGAMDSESFNKVFPNKLSRDIVKNRIIDYVNAKRGKRDISEKDQRFLRRLNRAAGFGVAKVLAGVTQPAKQLVPLANTTINAGPANTYRGVALLINGGMKIIDDSGMPIANRGIMSQADIEGLNTLIEKSARTKGGKAIDLLDKVNKKLLDVLLVKSDVIAARASFLAYYMQAMNKKGVASKDIDWTKPLEKDAKTFAQQQVDRQQNTSDADLQGRLFTSQETTPQVLRKILFPFANFLINQKNRMYSDVSTLFNNKDFVKGDKNAAARSLVGLGVETAIFNTLGYYISTTLASITASLMGGETPEEEEKRKMYAKRGRIGSVVADVAVPLPFLNDTMLSALNTGMELLESGDEEGDPFRFFAKDEKTVLDNLGVLGIAPKKAKILYEMIDLYRTGVSKNVFMGKKSTADISEDAREKMGTVASVYFLSLLGAGTAETNYMSERALKLAKKTREEKASKIVPFKTQTEKKIKEEELTMNPKKGKQEFNMNSNKNKEEFNMNPTKNKGEFNF